MSVSPPPPQRIARRVLVALAASTALLLVPAAVSPAGAALPTGVLAATPVVNTGATIAGYEADFADLLNGYRATRGQGPLAVVSSYSDAARGHSTYMATTGIFAHPADISVGMGSGWSRLGENIAAGSVRSNIAEALHNALVASEGHHANIVSTRYDSLGVGVAISADNRLYVTFRFADRNDVPAPGPVAVAGPNHVSNAATIGAILEADDFDAERYPTLFRLYRAYFNRPPDVGGAKYWIDVNQTHSLANISGFFTGSDEYIANYAGTDNAEFLARVYRNVLGRSFDQDGYDYWLDFLNGTNSFGLNATGQRISRSDMVLYFADSAELSSRFPYLPEG